MTELRTAPSLTCPKCMGQMRSYERSGVLVDQCVECRGIFLDRGELERLIDAEGNGLGAAAAIPAAAAAGTPAIPAATAAGTPTAVTAAPWDAAHRDHDEEWPSRSGPGHRSPGSADREADKTQPRRRGGLFGDVFDMFGGGE